MTVYRPLFVARRSHRAIAHVATVTVARRVTKEEPVIGLREGDAREAVSIKIFSMANRRWNERQGATARLRGREEVGGIERQRKREARNGVVAAKSQHGAQA